MPRNSKLVEYLFWYAERLMKKDGKRSLTANYFVIAALVMADSVEHNLLPGELNTANTKAEIEAMSAFLNKYGIDKHEVSRTMEQAVEAEGYDSSMDEFIFSKMHYNVEARAQKEGREVIDALLYLEQIFSEPTTLIKEYVLLSAEEDAAGQEDALIEIVKKRNDASAEADEIIKHTSEEGEGKSDEKSDSDVPEVLIKKTASAKTDTEAEREIPLRKPEPEKETGPQKLAGIVQRTRKIQSSLLGHIFGQDHAVNAFVSGYFQAQLMACSRKETGKPQATFLFAGPPGVGKTFLAEKSAEALEMPYMRFDMSEYSDKEANFEFCGSDKVYKNGKAGNVTSFVAENPECVLLFDEIEKAHLNVIHLFLQILDAGRLRDNFTDEEVSFSKAVLIFTTNVGRGLYEDPSIVNLSAIPRKTVLKSLAKDLDPNTGAPLFPAAICSRFASGNVIMFNHLEASNLYTIAKRELENNVKGLEASTGLKICVDDHVPSAIMFSEGGKADARTVKGRANAFFHEELYELFRLLASGKNENAIESLEQINITVPLEQLSRDIALMFENPSTSEALVFAGGAMAEACKSALEGKVICHFADSIDAAKDVLFNRDINVVLCDLNCGVKESDVHVLNAEDISSVGHDFLTYVLEKYSLPVYILQENDGEISQEEALSFAKLGARDVLTVKAEDGIFAEQVTEKCRIAYQQGHMLKLAKENKGLTYKTAQTVSDDQKTASIRLFDFKLGLITDAEDSKSIVDNVSRPDIHFEDVIGAEDAKQELKYFVEYLKNPVHFMRKGVRSPKGVLLYGPPGTGKTLLAKAMAGESGVTFLRAEGNEFLKKYIGEGAEAVHSLFNAARKYAPSIVFVDEIDAIGKDRNSRGSEDHTGDVLTAFLTEMDGFNTDTSKPVFVLAATNYGVDAEKGKSLDAALLRRFDRRIYVDLPNKEERKRYLEMKLRKHTSVQLSQDQLDNIAMRSTGMSLAELESVFEMALRNAIRSESGVVGDAEFEEAFETFNSGEKKEWSSDSLMRTARHEAGHALICWMSGEKPSYLTIVARGDHGGYMQHANSEGKGSYTKAELLGKIRTSLAGRAAEMVYYGDEEGISTGASGDLYSATRVAEQMICNFGMDADVGMSYIDLGAVSGAAHQTVRERVNAMLDQELAEAIHIIKGNQLAIDTIVNALMEKNHLKENEIDEIFSETVNIDVIFDTPVRHSKRD